VFDCAKSRAIQELFAMRTVVELVHLDCEDPTSILNVVDNKKKTIRKQLGIHIRNCQQALLDVEACVKRYEKLSTMDKLAWAWKGHGDVKDLESNLSSFATQLDSFVNSLTLRGVGAIYQKQRNIQIGIGRIEEALEKAKGDDKAAIKEVMQEVGETRTSRESTERYKSIISDYAHEVSRSTSFTQTRAQTPDAPRGRKDSSGSLDVPAAQNRAKSADTSIGANNIDVKKGSLPNKKTAVSKTKNTLECWLIQIKSGHLTIVTRQLCEKEIQCRGQWKLEEMAQQFKASTETKLDNYHDLVSWVLKDRNKSEEDSDRIWHPYAAKIERKGSLALNLGVEEQAMVIIEQRLSAAAQKKFDKKKKKDATKKEAERKNMEKEVAERKAKEAATKKAKDEKEKHRKAEEHLVKKQALVKRLEEENKKLKEQKKKADQEAAVKKVKDSAARKPKSEVADKTSGGSATAKKDNAQKNKGLEAGTKVKDDKIAPKAKDKTHVSAPKTSPSVVASKNSEDNETKPDCWNGSKYTKQDCPYPNSNVPNCWNDGSCKRENCPYTHKVA